MKRIIVILEKNNVTVPGTISEDEDKIIEIQKVASEIDSLTYISILMDIEKEFGIDLQDEALNNNVFLDLPKFEKNISVCLG